MKIKPYFKATLKEPFQGKYYHEAGAEVVLNTKIKSKDIGDFLITIPEPVSLNLNNAQNFIDKCKKLKERINREKQKTIFSGKLSEEQIKGLSLEEVKKLDQDMYVLRDLDNEKIYEYIQSSMGVVISLITAVESFVNMAIPYDFKLEKINKEGKKEILDKDKIIRKLSLEDKVELLGKIKLKNNIKQQKFWNDFKQVKDLRNDIIHFKKRDVKIDLIWNPIIVSFFDSDLQKFFDNIVDLINYIEPKYLEFEI